MDAFMNINNVYNVLKEKYLKYGKIIVAYDFDDTVRPLRSKDCSQVINIIRKIASYSVLICYTARENNELNMVKQYLIDNNIPFDFINKEYDGSDIVGKKIYYNVFLDDKCGLYEAYTVLERFLEEFDNKE